MAKTRLLYLLFAIFFTLNLTGCHALVRKFTRKSKKEPLKEEPVFQPQEYPEAALNKEDLYRDYFLFWQSWADELDAFLKEDANVKKQKQCAQEALASLRNMRQLLDDEKGAKLDQHIENFTKLKETIDNEDIPCGTLSVLRNRLARIKAAVHRGFIYPKVKGNLK